MLEKISYFTKEMETNLFFMMWNSGLCFQTSKFCIPLLNNGCDAFWEMVNTKTISVVLEDKAYLK